MKYMGSKSRIVKEILPIILKDRSSNQWYIEPFAGGMNVICNVDGNRIANDINPYLIAMWQKLVSGWVPEKISKEEYYKIKNNKNNYPDYLVGWVGFNCSYCGKWFDGFAGDAITKDGILRDFQSEAIKNCLKQVEKMNNIIFENKEYHELFIPKNSIIYCDPPYKSTTKYAYDINHNIFWDWVRNKSKEGHSVFISEYSAPPDFECVWQKESKSSLSANGSVGKSKLSIEKLFKYEGK